MTTPQYVPYALGCPCCPAEFTVPEEDPDATIAEVANHLRYMCRGVEYPDDQQVLALLARVLSIPDLEASRR